MADRVELDAGAVGFYADPMAYDILHGPGTTDEVRGLEMVSGRFVTGAAREGWWLEPGVWDGAADACGGDAGASGGWV
jgi:hypothetical protein